MCRKKKKSIAVLINVLNTFNYRIQCDKTRNFLHGGALEA